MSSKRQLSRSLVSPGLALAVLGTIYLQLPGIALPLRGAHAERGCVQR